MTRKSFPPVVWLLWALFLTRVSFYCVMMPLWEGWDEYAHFAWLDHWIATNTLPRFDDKMAREIEESLSLAPLSHQLSWMGPPHLIYEQWWALPESERSQRMRRLRDLPPEYSRELSSVTTSFYEAQQPPLYYWIASIPLRLTSSWRLTNRVLFLRFLSALVASFAIPFTWLAAQRLLGGRSAAIAIGLLAVAPGFAIDTFRVANDSLAIALFTLTLWLLLRSQTKWWQVGIALGLALLAKGYMLILIPIVLLSWLRRRRDLALALCAALAIAGWWYVRNLLLGNSLSGWLEHTTTDRLAHGIFTINWFSALNVIAKSFTWFGGWSFLTLKSWIYVAIEAIGFTSAALALYKKRGTLALPAIACGCFLAAMLYGTLMNNAVHATANMPGWYCWPAGGALAILVAAGPRWLSVTLVTMLALIDLYGATAILAPYYAGLAPYNRANAGLFFESLGRLHVPVALAIAWIAATGAIPIAICNRMRSG